MKKGLIICIFVALFTILCTIGTPIATAETSYPNIKIGGVELRNNEYLKSGSSTATSDKPADNYAYYNNGVLTLCNFSYTGAGGYINLFTGSTGIYSTGDLSIVLIGTNNINISVAGNSLSSAIYTKGNLTISGDGTCNATALNYGIFTEQNLTIENGNINAVAETGICANYNVTINGGTVDSSSSSADPGESFIAIACSNFIVCSGATIEASTTSNGVLGVFDDSSRTTYKRIRVTVPISIGYTVRFDANGSSSSMADITNIIDEFTLPQNSFTAPSGKQFKCWSVNGVEMQVGAKINLTSDITIKAIWEDIPMPEIWVGGIGMADGTYIANDSSSTTTIQPSSNGYAYYKDGVLYLNGYSFSSQNAFTSPLSSIIYSPNDINIVCVGNFSNTLVISGSNNYNGIESDGNISISGSGSLNITANNVGIKSNGSLTVNDIDIAITSTFGSAITALDKVEIDASSITINSNSISISAQNSITIFGDDVTIITNSNLPAIDCNMSITAEEFVIIGAPNENLINFINPSINIYAVYKGNSEITLPHVDFVYDNSTYSSTIDTNVLKIEITDHTLIGQNHDDEYHWDECSCGAKFNKSPHRGGTATCKLKATCADCSHEYGSLTEHNYGELIPTIAEKHTATELTPSVDAHYVCGDCGKYFTILKTETTLDELTGEIPTHNFSSWLHDDQKHWKQCTCGAKNDEESHHGGSATCEHKAICADCGEEYGNLTDHDYGELIPTVAEKHTATELSPSIDAHYVCGDCGKYFTILKTETTLDELTGEMPTHIFGGWLHDDQKHWKECSCGAKNNESNHNGGRATCEHKAICADCGHEYGNLADHNYGERIPTVAEKHTPTELSPSVDAHYVCGDCGKYFTILKTETTLDELTGETPTHSYIGWFYDNEMHWQECACGFMSDKANHHGGRATCEHKAMCADCGQEYDNLANHNYGELIPTVAEKHTATELSPSVDAHYVCGDCGKYFTILKTETTLDELTGETPAHNFIGWFYNNEKHWQECACGAKNDEASHIGGSATCEHKATCADCGQEYGNIATHNYGELIPTVAEKHTATELSPSVDAHYVCGDCGKYFTILKTETTLDELTGEMPTHNFIGWFYDNEMHWQECACGFMSDKTVHNGGSATCEHKATCADCGQEYGSLTDHDYGELIPTVAEKHTPTELSPSIDAHYVCGDCGKYFTILKTETTLDELTGKMPAHNFIGWFYDNEMHWQECACGFMSDKTAHNGGSSTCEHKATCADCGEEYGNLTDHDYGELIPTVAEKHTATELKPSIDAHYVCGDCGKYFTILKTETTLNELTGETPAHSYIGWFYDNEMHWQECSCGFMSDKTVHNGGSATCEGKAECADCGEEYGNLADHKYGELIPSVAEKHTATELAPSVDTHYVCGDCGKYFTILKTETTLDELTGEMPAHYFIGWFYDSKKHWQECACGFMSDKTAHNGGRVTCEHKATCADCGYEYGNLANHDYGELIPTVAEKHTATELAPSVDAHYICGDCGKYFTEDKQETTIDELTSETPAHSFGEWTHDDLNHWKECSCGSKTNKVLHSGGEATCEHKATCADCGHEYGNPADHKYGELIPTVAEKHTASELSPSVDAHYVCGDCGKYFTILKTETTLDELTGETPTHSYIGWFYNNEQHWKECSCGAKNDEANHNGGSATCENKAICADCGHEYGSLADHKYGKIIPAVAEKHTATELAPSIDAHYICGNCGKYFTEDKQETTLDELTGETPAHSFDNWINNDEQHWLECECGLKSENSNHIDTNNDAACDACGCMLTTKDQSEKLDKIALYILIGSISFTGIIMLYLLIKKILTLSVKIK